MISSVVMPCVGGRWATRVPSRIRARSAVTAKRKLLSESVFNWISRGYEKTLGIALRWPLLVLLALGATIALNVYLYNIVPKGFFPRQDTGRLVGSLQADQASSFQAVRVKLADFIKIVQSDPAVESVTGFTGGGQRNGGFMFIQLKPVKERKLTADEVIARLRPKMGAVAGATLFLNPVQDIRMGGRQSNTAYQFTLRSDNLEDLRTWTPRLQNALQDVPELADVNSDQQVRGLQTTLTIDRNSAARLGITDRHLRRAFGAEFGVSPVEFAQTQRLLLAKRLLTDTSLPVTEVAFASGFGSLRRFNALFKQRYRLQPSQLDAATLAAWQDQARLVLTIPGLRAAQAQLLVGAGYADAELIAAADAEKFCADVLGFAMTPPGRLVLRDGDTPDIERVRSWLEAARTVKAA